jgi:nucleoside-diphosphate-sugar epimerase
VVNLACDDGWKVRIFDRNPRGRAQGVELCLGELSDGKLLRTACEGISAIVHAAGLAHLFGRAAADSARFNAANETGTAKVAEAALECGVRHVVLASSVSVYGDYPGDRCDETVECHPKGPYAVSKWRGEIAAAQRMGAENGSLTILRFVTIYGEGDRGNVAKLIGALDQGRFIWPGSGLNQKSLIHREDAARACLLALEADLAGNETFNVSAPPATLREIVKTICQALDRPLPKLGIPSAVLSASLAVAKWIGDPGEFGGRLQKLTHDDVYDGSKFEGRFNFCPAISLSEGIRREVACLRARASR